MVSHSLQILSSTLSWKPLFQGSFFFLLGSFSSLIKVSKGKRDDHGHLWTNTSNMADISHNMVQSTQGKRHFPLDFLANQVEKEVVKLSHTGQPIQTQLTSFCKGACGRERHILHCKRKTFTFASIFYLKTQTSVYLYFRFSFFLKFA